MKTKLQKNEQIEKEGGANLQRGWETVGGKLYLTNQRLVFESHAFNIQRGSTEIKLSTIQSVQPCWTKFLGLLPLTPNSLAVSTKEGREYRFVLFNRQEWKDSIQREIG